MFEYEAAAGMSLWVAIEEAQKFARYKKRRVVYLKFNGVLLRINEDSLDEDIAEIYRLKRKCKEFINED